MPTSDTHLQALEPGTDAPTSETPETSETPGTPAVSGRSRRGRRRREELVSAGVQLLGESGWASLTTRAVAERSGANPGLVHYYWGGLPGLKAEVAQRAVADAFDPALELLTSADSWPQGLAAVVRAGNDLSPSEANIGAELIAASLRDPVVAELMRTALSDARITLSTWLVGSGVEDPEGIATLLLATLDGLLLHRLIDPDLPLAPVASAVASLPAPSPGA